MRAQAELRKARWLIVNADDFGQHDAVNEGIAMAHERGIVTSASMMVHGDAAQAAARYARAHPALDVGLHLDLCEFRQDEGGWAPVYERVDVRDLRAVAAELDSQVELFIRLVGRRPTHLDSHQHVHLWKETRQMVLALAERLELPLRSCRGPATYCGRFYGHDSNGRSMPDAISVAALGGILASLPAGVSELACHPATGPVPGTMYSCERVAELATLTDPAARRALERHDIELTRYSQLGQTGPLAPWSG